MLSSFIVAISGGLFYKRKGALKNNCANKQN